jgi:hypothetical protein
MNMGGMGRNEEDGIRRGGIEEGKGKRRREVEYSIR